jgi:hypothetical protein
VRRAVVLLTVLVFMGMAGADPYDSGKSGPSEVLLRAMQDELQRTVEQLRLGDLARPHFVTYLVLETQSLELQGSFGGLERPRSSNTRRLQVEVRVGSREFDDAHFLDGRGQGYRPLTGTLPVEDDYDALRAEIWSLTDRAYKAALERLARKTVYRNTNNIREVPPDLTDDPVCLPVRRRPSIRSTRRSGRRRFARSRECSGNSPPSCPRRWTWSGVPSTSTSSTARVVATSSPATGSIYA